MPFPTTLRVLGGECADLCCVLRADVKGASQELYGVHAIALVGYGFVVARHAVNATRDGLESVVVLTGLTSKQLRAFVNIGQVLPLAHATDLLETQKPRSRAARLSPADIVKIMQHYQAGKSLTAIAAELGMHRDTIKHALRRNGVALRSQRVLDPVSLQRAAELYRSGLSLAEVSQRVGFDSKTLGRGLRQLGVELRPKRKYRRRSGPTGD